MKCLICDYDLPTENIIERISRGSHLGKYPDPMFKVERCETCEAGYHFGCFSEAIMKGIKGCPKCRQ